MSRPAHEFRVVWAFWLAAGVAAVAGVVPVIVAGTSGRISGVIFPFGVAAIALAGSALLHARGRPVATGLYLVAGLLIVYGILAMVAVPLRLAVVGTCAAPPSPCGVGLERPLTEGESTGMAFATGMGIVALLVGFFGLVIVFRRQSTPTAKVEATSPPVRRIPPVKSKPAEVDPSETETATAPYAAPEPVAVAAPPPDVEPELPAPLDEPELPAPLDEPELPPHVEQEAPELPAPGPN